MALVSIPSAQIHPILVAVLNLSGAWLDEIASWQYPYESWTEGLAPALRIGDRPRVVVTTTPKPLRLIREWVSRTDGSISYYKGKYL
jgi:phage terminase large subunit-like protein